MNASTQSQLGEDIRPSVDFESRHLPRLAEILEDAALRFPQDRAWLEPAIAEVREAWLRGSSIEFQRRARVVRWREYESHLRARLAAAKTRRPEVADLKVFYWTERFRTTGGEDVYGCICVAYTSRSELMRDVRPYGRREMRAISESECLEAVALAMENPGQLCYTCWRDSPPDVRDSRELPLPEERLANGQWYLRAINDPSPFTCP